MWQNVVTYPVIWGNGGKCAKMFCNSQPRIYRMNLEEVLKLADELVFAHTGKHLNDLQETILRRTWEDEDYREIATASNRSEDRVRQVGAELWQILTEQLGEKVNKSNFRSAMQRFQFSLFSSKSIVAQQLQNSPVNFCLDNNKHPPHLTNPHSPHQGTSQPKPKVNQHQDLSEMPQLGALSDRASELQTLHHWILQQNCHLVAINGLSGMGKTALAVQLTQSIKHQFDYVVWRTLDNTTTFAHFQADLIDLFSHHHKPTTLLKHLQKHRCFIILDDIHHLFSSGELAGHYKPSCEEYRTFFKQIDQLSHNSCVLLVGWEQPRELAHIKNKNTHIRTLTLTGLNPQACLEILQEQEVTASGDWEDLIHHYQGNPLWLKCAATLIEESGCSLTEFLQNDTISLPEDLKDIFHQQYHRLSEIEKQVMSLLAEEPESVSLAKLLEKGQIPSSDLLNVLQSLSRRCLVERPGNVYTISPVMRQYIKEL